jgi:hypothetical protein
MCPECAPSFIDEAQIRAEERERCAKLLEYLAPAGTDSVLLAAAKEIRSLK